MANVKDIKEEIEQRLQKQQASKEFKDIGRVAQTRKEKSAFRLINSKILTDLEDDSVMAYNMVKKENVWTPIDIKEERERGVSSGALYMKVKLREAVPTRPKDDRYARERYVAFLENLQNDLLECFTYDQVTSLLEKLRVSQDKDMIVSYFIDPRYGNETEGYKEAVNEELKDKNPKLWRELQFPYRLFPRLTKEVFGARFENMMFRGSEASAQIWKEAKLKEPLSEKESLLQINNLEESKQKLIILNKAKIEDYKLADNKRLRELQNTWRLNSQHKNDLELFRQMGIKYYENDTNDRIKMYDNKIEASKVRGNDWSWLEVEVKEETKEKTTKERSEVINTKTPLLYIKRTGGAKIDNLSPNEIVDKFGFSAVNYGVYVDDRWSKEHTKHFLGAMSDMGEMLNLNIKDANQLGKLAIAFGAKGRKGSAASYFPQTKDINLTKSNGDGSVAHEWGHYFDNVIVELDQKKATNDFGSEGLSPDFELKALYKELMDFIYKGNDLYTPRVPMTFYPVKSWDGNPPNYYRGYTSEKVQLKDTIEETINQYLDLAVVSQDRHDSQIRIFGYIIDAFGLDSYDVPMKLKTSYLYHKTAYRIFKYCAKDERGRWIIAVEQRSKYWTSAVELFARSWETMILKKLLSKNRVSNYLVDDIPMEEIIAEGYNRPYPSGKELDYIEIILDKIVARAKQKYNLGDFVAPSSSIEDTYIDLKGDDSGEADKGMIVEKKGGKKEIEYVDESKVEVVKVEETSTEPTIEDVVEDVVGDAEPTREEIIETIDALQILADTGNEAALETIEALKLLI